MVEMEELVEDWLTSVKDSSARQYRYHFKRFLNFAGMTAEEFLEEARNNSIKTKTRINQFFKHLERQDKASSYIATNQYTVKSFLNYYEINPLKTRKPKVARRNTRKALRRDDVKKLVDCAPHLRDKALIVLAFQTGMSISDLLALNFSDVRDAIETEIDFPSYLQGIGIITYIRGKVTVESKAVFGQDSIAFLRHYIDWQKKKGSKLTDKTPLFVRIRKTSNQQRLTIRSAQAMLRKVLVKAGITTFEELAKYERFNPYSFHAIRKAFSSIALIYGMPKDQVDMSQGHALAYNGAYIQFTDKELIRNFKAVEPQLSVRFDVKELEDRTKELETQLRKKEQELLELKEEIPQLIKNQVYELLVEKGSTALGFKDGKLKIKGKILDLEEKS